MVRLERRSPDQYTSEMSYPSFLFYQEHAHTLSAAMAVLADEGKMAWDYPVRKYLPWFHLSDPRADRLVTLRDEGHVRTLTRAEYEALCRETGKVTNPDALLDFLHRHLTSATENIQANEDGVVVTLGYGDWQRVMAVQMVLARYVRAVAEPEAIED